MDCVREDLREKQVLDNNGNDSWVEEDCQIHEPHVEVRKNVQRKYIIIVYLHSPA